MTDADEPTVRRSDRPHAIALMCAALAVLASLLTLVGTQGGWPDPTALVNLSGAEPLAPVATATDPDFVLVGIQQHYDGVYYYAIARDPLARGLEHTLIDQAPYRYGHPMLGWLARLVSLGKPAWIPGALLALTLLGMAGAGWAASRLSSLAGRTPWGGLVVAASPGLLYATTVSTTETVSAALLGLTLLAWWHGHLGRAAAVLVVLCLTKEQYVVVPLGLAFYEAARAIRAKAKPARWPALVAALAAGPAALLGWVIYLHATFGQWPSTGTSGNVAAPLVGWWDTFRQARGLASGSFEQSQIGTVVIPVLVATAVLCLVAAVRALRLQEPIDGVVLGLVAVLACLGPTTLLYPHEMVRNPAVTLLIAVGALLLPRRPSVPVPA